ncbi:MAG: iron-sulfur cluster assembly accessory protein [Pseudomonadota bacterium]
MPIITLTQNAAQKIQESAETADMQEMSLRIAVSKNQDESFEYAMGFDDNFTDADMKITSNGVNLVVSENSLPLLKDMTLDYVELEPGEFHFIFLNPNDPSYIAPQNE